MNKQTLFSLKKAAEEKFAAVQQEASNKQAEVEELNKELIRLQGEYRSYDALIATIDGEAAGLPEGLPDPSGEAHIEDGEKVKGSK